MKFNTFLLLITLDLFIRTVIACFLPGLAFMLGIEFKQYIVRVAVVMGVFLISVFTIRTFSGHIYLAFMLVVSY